MKKNENHDAKKFSDVKKLNENNAIEIQNIITDEKLDKYFSVTKRALDKLKITIPKKTHLYNIAIDYLDMATCYYDDAVHFKSKKDYINAFASLNYSHGWLDAGARIGLFDVDHDSTLFTVD